jgi:hypothetical protein
MVKIQTCSQSAGKKFMEIEKLNWLAGIIDGEGSFTLNRRCGVNSGQDSFITRLQIGNTDMGMIQKVSEILVPLGIKFYYGLHNPNKKFPNAKRYLTINIEGYRSMSKLIKAIDGKLFTHQKSQQIALFKEYITFREKIASGEEVRNPEKDKEFALKVKTLCDYQISPSTTLREASTVLRW